MRTVNDVKQKKVVLVDDIFNSQAFILTLDGVKILACPYHPPAVVPDRFQPNKQVMINRGCGSWCSLFRITTDADGVVSAVQGCTAHLSSFNVVTTAEKSAENSPENKSGIILT